MIPYIERTTGKICQEKVYGGALLAFLYGGSFLGNFLQKIVSKNSFISSVYGWWQKQPWTRKKIAPFIQTYDVDASAFAKENFYSFNDFFIRKLKPEARPIDPSPQDAIIPADGRYRFYTNIGVDLPLLIKGESLSLEKLLLDKSLAYSFLGGTAVVARLCPSDYHRFHFPCANIPSATRLINGFLYSVSPWALKKNGTLFAENRRTVTLLNSSLFGQIAYIEIGATNVGTIHQTFTPLIPVEKGQEKGFFSFGGSALVLLFPPQPLTLAPDLPIRSDLEIRCLMGQPLLRRG